MKLSVIIPVYKVEDYLRECLDSCLTQNIDDCEFICVNDGSPDSCPDILNEYAHKDSRIKVINKENGGLSSARNAGINAASGKWVMFLDSDDKLHQGSLEKLLNVIESEPDCEMVAFNTDTFPVDIKERPWLLKTLKFPDKKYTEFTADMLFNEKGSMPFIWRHAYKMDAVRRSKVVFDESLKFGEDVQYAMEILPQLKGFVFSEICVLSYRLDREGSLMSDTNADSERLLDRHFEILERVASYWKEKGWFDLYGAQFLEWSLKYTLLKVKALSGKTRKEKAWKMMKEILPKYGLDAHKGKLSLKGKAMLAAYSMYAKI